MFTEVVPDADVEARASWWAEKVARMPADGIVMAKEAFRLVEQLQGRTRAKRSSATSFHAYGTNLQFDEDEFNFVKARAQARHQARLRAARRALRDPRALSRRRAAAGTFARWSMTRRGARRRGTAFVEGLRAAGVRLATEIAALGPEEQADGYRALLRGLGNQLGRFETDRERPELVPFNGWRQKMFMDNPDFRYWVADVRDDRRYRITGAIGDAVYLSITAYSSGATLDASATARVDSDSLAIDAEGRFALTVSREAPADGSDWLALPEGATALWVRQFHHDVANDRLGWCEIEPLDAVDVAPSIDPDRFERHLRRLGRGIAAFPAVWTASTADDLGHPNEARHWSEMAGGAAFTEPNIHYLRGAWQLEDGEALVIEGVAPPCRYWNVLLYSRFLNSLDHRYRTVSRTDGTAQLVDGRYRVVLAGRDPGGAGDWLDTEERPFGLFVFRFLQAEREPELPTVRRCSVAELIDAGEG